MNKAMKHLIIDARESGTSTGRYIDKLIEYLHKLPEVHEIFEVTVLAKAHRLSYFTDIAPTFQAIETKFEEFTFAEQMGFKKQIESLQPDLVHFPAVQQPVWLAAHPASNPGQRSRVVTTMQDLTTLRFRNPAKNPIVFTLKLQVYKWVNQRVARQSDALITPTEFVRQDVASYCHISPDPITVTWEAADDLPKPAVQVDGLSSATPFIMYTGRPTPHKNLERLIQAFASLHDKHPDLQLVLVGKQDANYRRIAANVAKQGIANITFTGFVSDQQLRWLYEHCRAYVMPSLSEGFSLTGIEAMRHGAPVVSSNATCLPEVHGDAALYFDPLDISDMASKINQVITDEKLRRELIAKGAINIKRFSWQKMAEQTFKVYQRVLGNE
jgi:glycosyltransferase involved in cell wall biosynthesis